MSITNRDKAELGVAQNYIVNGGAESGLAGWQTYADAASNIPVNGTGGTATGLSFTAPTSSPLRAGASFLMTQANSTSLQGKGVSYDFTVSSADKASVLSISFEYNASSTFVASDGITPPLNDGTTTTNAGNSDIEVFLYDVTNSVLIPVSPQVVTAKGSNNFKFQGQFQTNSNSTSYRLIFHVATANANATGWTFKFDSVVVEAQSMVVGSPVSDWTPYSLVIGATGTAPTTGTLTSNLAEWRRVGDSMEIRYDFKMTTDGTDGVGNYLFPLPAGYSADSNKIVINGSGSDILGTVGSANASIGLTTIGTGYMQLRDASNMQMIIGGLFVGSVNYRLGSGASPREFSFQVLVPIAGWSSTVQVSNASDNRVVAAAFTGNTTALSAGVGSYITFSTTTFDTHAGFNGTTDYIIPVSGFYSVEAQANMSVGATNVSAYILISIYKNGVLTNLVGRNDGGTSNSTIIGAGLSGVIQCVAGDIIKVRIEQDSGATRTPNVYLYVNKVSGSSTIAASEAVVASYSFSSAQSIPNTATYVTIIPGTKQIDTHAAMNSSTGVYTVSVSGYYEVTGYCGFGPVSTSGLNLQFYKNGSPTSIDAQLPTFATNFWSIQAQGIIQCVAGDTIYFAVAQSGTTNNNNAANFYLRKI